LDPANDDDDDDNVDDNDDDDDDDDIHIDNDDQIVPYIYRGCLWTVVAVINSNSHLKSKSSGCWLIRHLAMAIQKNWIQKYKKNRKHFPDCNENLFKLQGSFCSLFCYNYMYLHNRQHNY